MVLKVAADMKLFNATLAGDVKAGIEALAQGANIDFRDGKGRTLLHYASCYEHYDFVRFLLDNGADANIKDNDGWSPLKMAIAKENEGIVRALVIRTHDLEERDESGWTLLMHAAIRSGYITELLLKNGADVDAMDNDGNTALVYAISDRKEDSINALIEHGATQTENIIFLDLQRKVDDAFEED